MSNKRTILPREREYEFSGAKLNYRVTGSGKPVILLHGSMVADPWGGFEKLLARHYQVYLPELPGFGASETVPGRVHDTQLFGEAFDGVCQSDGAYKGSGRGFFPGNGGSDPGSCRKGN